MEEICRGRRLVLARIVDDVMGRSLVADALIHPGAVAVVAVNNGMVLLERQYRPVVGRWIYEIPAGTLEEEEDPEETAIREMVEETGYRPGVLRHLASFYTSPGTSTEVLHLFLAGELEHVGARPEEDEVIEVLWVPLGKAISMILDGRINDAKTIIGLTLYYIKEGGGEHGGDEL